MTDRIKELEDNLFNMNTYITEQAEDELYKWIDINKLTRAEAEIIADKDGTFLEQRLYFILERQLENEDEDNIFYNDKKE